MKFGLNTAILEHLNLDEVLEFTHKVGFKSLEVCCWPQGDAERRYGGVTHIDVTSLDKNQATTILDKFNKADLEISALAYYPNPLDHNQDIATVSINHLYKVIDGAKLLNVDTVTTFIGRNHTKSIEENLEIMVDVWTPILEYANEKNIKIAIENCPMIFSKDEWPGGKNLFTTPSIWKQVFNLLPFDNLGINYDPSHLVWQNMDYIKPIYEFKDKIFHVHFKDLHIFKDKLDQFGIMSYPLNYMTPKLPGLGDVDWSKYISALYDIGYEGHACIEVEDKSFENTSDRVLDSVILSHRYLNQFVI